MVLLSDAVWIFVKGLAELEIVEELNPPEIACRRNRPWQQGRRILEFIKAVSKAI